jgi:hypothetical protein
MPITKIHFVRKARDRLWITAWQQCRLAGSVGALNVIDDLVDAPRRDNVWNGGNHRLIFRGGKRLAANVGAVSIRFPKSETDSNRRPAATAATSAVPTT